ncbi:MAG: dsRBD fold-containing protein [Acidimicrobiia bacterium]
MRRSAQVSLHIEEDDQETTVHARLDLQADRFESYGKARRNPDDPILPAVGEELAIARALGSLTAQIMEAAQDRITELLA